MDSCCIEAELVQPLNEHVYHSLGVGKDEHLVVFTHRHHDSAECPEFVGSADGYVALLNLRDLNIHVL